ncbi:hypothetical protein QJS10_CPA01g01854 [Acorus calamus]|uniref:DUF1985 domain-containing protein n=1 Tax=Acorus calamus TaxID=4465 RepID=A0AAV9FKB4_ACOCL|nr:hypothetical protein QJS10_CPA01g01854 [Acorus calamus]
MSTRRFGYDVPSNSNISFVEQEVVEVEANEPQLVEKICRCFDSNDRFILGGVTCKFSKEEVELITGLSFHGKALDLHSKKVSDIHLLQKHFSSTHLHRKDVRQKLIQLHPSKEEENQEDFVRILIILICATFLLPNMGYACPNNVARYLENLDAIWEFSWALAVHEMIINDLRLFAQRVRQRETRAGVNPGYIIRCTVALMVDPKLNIGRDEEHLFRPHDATLIVEKIRMRAIKQLRQEERIKEKGKRKVLEGAKQKEGNKKKTEEEVERGEGGEDFKRNAPARDPEAEQVHADYEDGPWPSGPQSAETDNLRVSIRRTL